jgi:serine/threonine protein kinase/regulator of sirC expression with transglutaminase-like and TPR domain
MTAEVPVSWSEVDQFVEAFERMYAQEGRAEVARFLPPPDHPLYITVLEELLRVDLELSWRSGRRKRVEEFVAAFPALQENEQILEALRFEERRLRLQSGDTAEEEQQGSDAAAPMGKETHQDKPGPKLTDQAPLLEQTVDYLVQSHPPSFSAAAHNALPATSLHSQAYADVLKDLKTLHPEAAGRLAQAITTLPQPGRDFLGFRLLEELGRGAFGRVFLAREKELAQRLVVLKIAPNLSEESHALAQLQHTNIVPILSLHRAGLFQAIVMPYHGGNTLAKVVDGLRSTNTLPTSGNWVTEFLTTHKRTIPGAPPHPALVDFHQMSYVQAVLWLAERLAEGLGHAHASGIRHYDLKPANVLLADSGEPMLLDFNQAEDTKRGSSPARAYIGGTLPYMAPEHLLSMRDGQPRMDERSDIYSLGLILFELLTGRYPFPLQGGTVTELVDHMLASREGPPPRARALNPQVSRTEEAILRRCLEPDPKRRYQQVSQLKEDLELHRNHLPLRHTPNPSLPERMRKWVRRHPRLASSYSVGVIALIFLGLLCALLYRNQQELTQSQERLAWEEEGAKYRTFNQLVRQSQALVSQPQPEPRTLAEGVQYGIQALQLFGASLHAENWSRAQWRLPSSQAQQLRQQVPQLLLYLAHAERQQALLTTGPEQQAHLEKAWAYHRWARQLPESQPLQGALLLQESILAEMRGDQTAADRLETQGKQILTTSWEGHCLLGVELMSKCRFREALGQFQAAQEKDASKGLVWFHLGLCHSALGQTDKALACFSTLIALEPEDYLAYYARGRARHAQGDFRGALADFDQALRRRPGNVFVLADRGLAHLDANQWQPALADFNAALAGGLIHTRLYLLRAVAREQLGDVAGGAADRKQFLETTPTDEQSWLTRGHLRKAQDPAGALADFAAALQANPRSYLAWENQANLLDTMPGKQAEVLQALNRALALAPDYVKARAGRGVILARMGKRAEALADAQEALRLENSPAIQYQVAGIYALTSQTVPHDRLEAYRLLAAALSAGYGFNDLPTDPDLKPLRQEAAFNDLQNAALQLRKFLALPAKAERGQP